MSSQSKICALIVGKFYKNYCIETIRIVRDLIPRLSFSGPCGNRELDFERRSNWYSERFGLFQNYAISVSRKNLTWISVDKFSIFEFFVQI